MYKKTSLLSIASLACSLACLGLYALLFQSHPEWLRVAWIVTGVLSVILPIVAKVARISNKAKGKVFEIMAIIVAFFNFCAVIMFGSSLPAAMGYVIPIICIIIYAKLGKVQQTTSSENSLEE